MLSYIQEEKKMKKRLIKNDEENQYSMKKEMSHKNYKKIFEDKDQYINRNKKILDKEYELIEKLSKIRHEKKLTQRQLAELTGIKQPRLASIEKGKNSPQLNTLLQILNSLGYTIDFKRID